MQVKKQQLELDMEQWTGSKFGKEYDKAAHCHSACLTFMQSTSCEMPGWMKHTGWMFPPRINNAWRNINNLRYVDDTTLMAESEEKLKSLLMRGKEESEKAGFKLNTEKTKIIASDHTITSCQIEEGKVEGVTDFTFLGSQITADGDCSHEIKILAPHKEIYDKSSVSC